MKVAADAEVTTEANPESTSPEFFEGIRAAGYTRVSLGMQSAAPAVLYMKGTPDFPQCGFSAQTVAALRACKAQFAHVNIFEDPEVREALKTYSNWPSGKPKIPTCPMATGSRISERLSCAAPADIQVRFWLPDKPRAALEAKAMPPAATMTPARRRASFGRLCARWGVGGCGAVGVGRLGFGHVVVLMRRPAMTIATGGSCVP